MFAKKLTPMLFLSSILLAVGLACSVVLVEATPIPATATVEATLPVEGQPTPTQVSNEIGSSQPLNERFYTQDFDEPLTKWSYVLTSGDKDNFSLKVIDGFFVFDEKAPDIWAYALYDEFTYTDVSLDVRVENLGTNSYQVNLICRYDEHEGWWEVNVKNGLYEMRYGKWDDNMIKASYTRIASGASTYWKNGLDFNDIKFVCADSGLTLSINGHEASQAKDDRHFLLKGQVGVGASSFDDPRVLVQYDWVKIGEK